MSEDGLIKLGGLHLVGEPREHCMEKDKEYKYWWNKAPEVFGEREELRSDVWSLGISLFEMVMGKHPLRDCVRKEEAWKEVRGLKLDLSERVSDAFVRLLDRCLMKNVNERWKANDLVSVRES